MANNTERYKEILTANGIRDKISRINIQESGAKGDGMASVTHCVTVEFDSDTKRKPLNLFSKIHTENPSHEMFINELRAFEKESQFFMEYLPAANALCEKYGLSKLMDIYPKCYFGDKNIIVLENLALEKGYEMWSHDIRHNFEQAIVVLKSLATHHALSYAMVEEYGGAKSFLEKFSDFEHDSMTGPVLLSMIENFAENALQTNITIVEKNMQSVGPETIEKLKPFKGKFREMTLNALRYNKDEKVGVLIHGDFKNNNMMFRKESKPLQQIIIDFQTIRYNSPTIDVVNYLFSSVNSKIRQSNLKELLDSYLLTFNNVTEGLGQPASLSYEDLLQQYKRSIDVGFITGMIMIGPGMALVKMSENMDVDKLNMDELVDVFHQNLLKWIEQHPEKGREMAEEVVCLLEEYENLSGN